MMTITKEQILNCKTQAELRALKRPDCPICAGCAGCRWMYSNVQLTEAEYKSLLDLP